MKTTRGGYRPISPAFPLDDGNFKWNHSTLLDTNAIYVSLRENPNKRVETEITYTEKEKRMLDSTKNRRDDYCGQGLLVLLARQKNTPGRAWQRVLFNCPYGHRTNQTYIAAKHPKHFYVKDNLSSTRAVVDEAGEVVDCRQGKAEGIS
jgi:hypothetical protein